MRVIAKEMGIHPVLHGRVRPGEVFEVPDGVTDSWFAPVTSDAGGEGAKRGRKPRAEPQTLRDLQAEDTGLNDIA
jgi:hypothetical protein